MKSHLLVLGYDDAEVLKKDIINAIQPEFEWFGSWKACFPAINIRYVGNQERYWLQPLLWSIVGSSVPYDIPVRFKSPSDSLMSLILQHYREHYRQAPLGDRLAVFAASMGLEEKSKRRKKGGAK